MRLRKLNLCSRDQTARDGARVNHMLHPRTLNRPFAPTTGAAGAFALQTLTATKDRAGFTLVHRAESACFTRDRRAPLIVHA